MTIRIDPENNEPRALFDLADFNGQRVLGIGRGDGRFTWRWRGADSDGGNQGLLRLFT